MHPSEKQRAIEAILFAAGYPVPYDKLAETLECPVEEIRQETEAMLPLYEERGIQLILYADTCQLCTRETYENHVKRALGLRGAGALSGSLLEVLAIVAYHQPVTRAFIEQVRGVDSSYAVSSLCEKQLIECTGRLDVPGKPMLFSTTATFLRVFGLASVEELPKAELLDVIGTSSASEPVGPLADDDGESSDDSPVGILPSLDALPVSDPGTED